MKPIEFPGSNVVLGAEQPEYQPLPALRLDDPEGTVISCWELTPQEIDRLGYEGKLWISQLTFGAGFSPQLPSVDPPQCLLDQFSGDASTQTVAAPLPTDPGSDPSDDEMMDLYRMDCRVGIRYPTPLALIDDVLLHALRAMLAQDARKASEAAGLVQTAGKARRATGVVGVPPVGAVITLMMSVDRSGCSEAGSLVLLSGLGGQA